MPYITFLKDTHLNYLFEYKRIFIYTLIIFIVSMGHHCLMQISIESFKYIRHTTMSMLCLLCFYGTFIIVKQKKCSRADMLFVLVMIFSGLTNLLSLIKGLTNEYAAVVEYKFMSLPMLIYGAFSAYLFLLYPIESLRPGWLSLKRSLLLLSPILFVIIIYVVERKTLTGKVFESDDWTSFIVESSRLNIFISLLILAYPLFGVAFMMKYRRGYVEWCENNFASMKNIDIKWLDDYIFANLVFTLSSMILVFCNNVKSALMHSIIFLVFFLYGFYRVLFRKSPYPKDYFKEGMNERDAQIREDEQTKADTFLNSENEIDINRSFKDRLPYYKARLEEWMVTEKPYLRKDFKLVDAMEILPLNRSYLSRLFNEGYGESFYHYVMHYRIEESKRLLLSQPNLKITEIAELSGFSSISVFGRAFTQRMECSPMQWREKNMKT